jgi:phosphotransferase system IIA component
MKLPGLAVLLGLFVVAGWAQAQAQAPADRSLGVVTSIDPAHHTIVLKEDKGSSVTVTVGEKTFLLRVPPGETDMKKATRIAFTDIGVGDRLVAAGTKSGDQLEARTVVIMNKADIAQENRQEQEEWQKRGISGTVASLAPEQKSFVLAVGDKKYTVTATDKTECRRYAADSANYSDSRPSSLAEMKSGDQVRVLGTKDDAALTVAAERVVFGTFARVAGVVTSVNAETGEIKLSDLFNKKPVIIQVTAKSNTRRLPEAMANQIAQRFKPRDDGAGPEAAGRGGRGGGRPRQMDLSQIVDRLPSISVADLKSGSAIVLTGTPQADASHVTAITIIAGIEPIVTAGAPTVRDLIGGWNPAGGGGGEGGEPAQ